MYQLGFEPAYSKDYNLVSHITYVGGRLKSTQTDRFHGIFIYSLRVLCQKSKERKSAKKYFLMEVLSKLVERNFP